MPTGLRGGSSGGSGGLTPPRNFGTGTANQTASQAGKVVFGLSNPSETMVNSAGNLTAGFIGVGKGLVSLAENLPVVGAVAKPLIGFAGGIADATIGRGVSELEKIKVGDKNLAQLAVGALETVGDVTVKPAIDILSAPGRFVEQKTAEARILNTKDKRNDIVTLLFGNAPASALNSIRAGATVEEAALELANSNAGFSESGAMNFLYSLVLDPMNLILPGVGKVGSIAKQASHLNKITKAALTAEEAAFVEKWSFAGKIYENTLGKASEITKRFSTNIVKEAALGWTRVYDVKAVGAVVDDVERVVGREVADRMLNNYAATFYNGIKSAAVRTSAARYRSWAEDFSDNVVNDLITAARETGSAATALRQQAGVADTIGSLLVKAKMNQKQIDELVAAIDEKIGRKVRNDEILKSSDIIRIKEELSRLQNNILVEGDKNVILEMAKYRTGANARYASDDAIRLFREDKMSEIPVARDPQAALKQLTDHIAAGAGITAEEAAEIAARQLAAANGDIRKITDILAFAKGSAFGQAMRETATIRSLFDEADDFSRLTIISGRSLTKREVTAYRARVAELKGRLKAATDAKDEVASKAVKEEMRALSDELVSKYDEFSSRFANDTFTYDQVFKHLDDSDDLTVMELTKKDLAKIAAGKTTELKQLGDLQRRLEAYGYRLGISPKSGLVQKTKTLVADRYGREKFVEISAPFVDTLDHLDVTTKFSGKVDTAIAAAKSRPSTLGRVWEAFTRPYGSEITKSNIAERFVTNMVAKTGISVNQAREIMSRVNSLAAQLNRKPQALFMERSLVDEIFRDVMRDNYGRLASAGTYPVKEILEAAAGDWSVAGLTSGFTGRVKAWRPEITILTDILYPDVRFGKLNPYFNLVMERVETNIQLRVHGIKKEFAREALGDVATGAGVRGSAARKAYLSNANVNREINDAVLDTLTNASVRNLTYAANGSTAFANRVRQTLAKYSSIDRVRFNKDIARNIMADKFAAREFIDILEQVAPGKLNELAIHFGVKKADEVVELLLSEYLIQADPVRFAKHVKDLGPSARGISVKTLVESGMDTKQAEELVGAVVGAYEAAILRGSRIADKAQYFASQRSWFERSINHPFLALYPYSYMVQKAIPSLMRVMFAPRVLGEVAPMLGIIKWEQAQEYMQNQLNTDKDVIGQVLSNDALLWMLTTILPTTPDSSGFSMPAWMRRGLAQPALKGEDITLGSFAPTLTEAGSTVVRGSVLGQIRTSLEGIQEATDILSGEIKKNILDELGSDIRNP